MPAGVRMKHVSFAKLRFGAGLEVPQVVAGSGDLTGVLDEAPANQPTERRGRNAQRIQGADFDGKLPRIAAGVPGALPGLEQLRQRGTNGRRQAEPPSIHRLFWLYYHPYEGPNTSKTAPYLSHPSSGGQL